MTVGKNHLFKSLRGCCFIVHTTRPEVFKKECFFFSKSFLCVHTALFSNAGLRFGKNIFFSNSKSYKFGCEEAQWIRLFLFLLHLTQMNIYETIFFSLPCKGAD